MTAQRLSAGPGLHLESPYFDDGLVVAGVDEVGKGSWAGPLVVGVAVLGPKVMNGQFPDGMRDSKALTERVRERVFDSIGAACSSWSTGWASAQECDELGMSEAQRLACERAFGSLGVSVDVAIVDGRWDFVSPLVDEVVMQVKADRECASVAAASVLAKVSATDICGNSPITMSIGRSHRTRGIRAHNIGQVCTLGAHQSSIGHHGRLWTIKCHGAARLVVSASETRARCSVCLTPSLALHC